MRVAVLSGGTSGEHEISLASGRSIVEGLGEGGHDAVEILITREGHWLHDGSALELIPREGILGCEVAFPALHGPGGEDGTVQAVLETLDVAYVGSGVEASAVCMDKLALKALAGAQGIPQVPYLEALDDSRLADALEELGSPVWVKPAHLGSSLGISRVDDPRRLEEAVALARGMDTRVIIEADAAGKEVECSVLGNGSDLTTSEPGELRVNADWYDWAAKYEAGGMDLRVPARISGVASNRVKEIAMNVFRLAGCAGMARCDFFVDGDDVLLNEVNTIPGFTETSVFSKLFEASGVAYPDLIGNLLSLALEAKADRDRLATGR